MNPAHPHPPNPWQPIPLTPLPEVFIDDSPQAWAVWDACVRQIERQLQPEATK